MSPDLARQLELWGLELDGAPVQGAAGEVVFVRRGAERLVLKRNGEDEAAQPRVLDHWGAEAPCAWWTGQAMSW